MVDTQMVKVSLYINTMLCIIPCFVKKGQPIKFYRRSKKLSLSCI